MNKDIEDYLIKPDLSLKKAMQRLDATMRKIVFVLNDNKQLIGALTDGDVRRWLLSGGNIYDTIEKVYNRNPLYYKNGVDTETIKQDMLGNRAACVPIVDAKRKIIKLVFWQDFFGTKKTSAKRKVSLPVVIMAGGKGTRLDPFTRILPKPLIPIGDSTIIEIIIDKFTAHRIKDFYITLNYKANIIKSYFDELKPAYNVSYLHEKQFLGTAGGLKALQGKLDGAFLLTNCDTIIDTDYFSLVQYHESKKNDITIIASMLHHTIPYGVCEITEGGILKELKEKPEFSMLVNTGMYLINTNLLKHIPRNQIFHMTDLIARAKAAGAKIGVYPIGQSDWIDTGEWTEYKKALERLAI